MKRAIILLLATFFIIMANQSVVSAGPPQGGSGDERYEGEVSKIIADRRIEVSPGISQPYQQVEVLISSGKLKGRSVTAEIGGMVAASDAHRLHVGDKIYVLRIEKEDGTEVYIVGDFIRRTSIYILAVALLAAVVMVGGFRGLTSFLGLIISFAVLLLYIIPRIVAGENPVTIAITGSCLILLTTLYLAHGFNRKTTAAIIGTSISLIITGLLAWFFVGFARLSGFVNDEAGFLSTFSGVQVNLQGILLGGIIIGTLGVLNDITISQSACVFELYRANNALSWKALYFGGIRVGRDHIASMVNTLVLAYAGASLPLFLVFTLAGGEAFDVLINREIIATEIVRTLVGSLGLVSAVPVTTAFAAVFCRSGKRQPLMQPTPNAS
ncbi:MAG: YibE/F family protein [Dehalococcoidia bacterium]|nr:YibE/F family protein [Dehalococcoidia bacterium]